MGTARHLALSLTALLLLAPAAGAILQLDGSKLQSATLEPVADGSEVSVTFPFELSEPAGVYAKVLPTPDNAVHDGASPNGTVAEDHSQGLSGWWLTFSLTGPDGVLLTDANGDPVPTPLGSFATGTPTEAVPLDVGTPYALQITVHAPQDAFDGAGEQTVFAALGVKSGGDAGRLASSGASRDEATALEIRLAPPSGDGGGMANGETDGSASDPSGDGTGADGTGGTGIAGTGQSSLTGEGDPSGGAGEQGASEGTTQAETGLSDATLEWLLLMVGLMVLVMLVLVALLLVAVGALVFFVWREVLPDRAHPGNAVREGPGDAHKALAERPDEGDQMAEPGPPSQAPSTAQKAEAGNGHDPPRMPPAPSRLPPAPSHEPGPAGDADPSSTR